MATNVTENQPIKNKQTSNTNKMWFTTFSNMRSIIVLLVLGKEALYLLEKIVCYIKLKIIAFFCVMLIAYLPTSGIQNTGHFSKIPWILPNFP